MWALNNQESSDQYTDAATLELGNARRASFTVLNNAVFIELKTEPRAGLKSQALWGPPIFVPPGSFSIVRVGLFAVRFRSAAEGKPAFVTIQAVAADE